MLGKSWCKSRRTTNFTARQWRASLRIADTLVRSGAIDLIVVDSVAALIPKSELEGDMTDHAVGTQARLMSKALRKLAEWDQQIKLYNDFINQLRMKIGVMFGNPETTTGGNALKFYASIRLDIRRTGSIKKGSDILGNSTRVKVVKNKLAPPFQQVEYDTYVWTRDFSIRRAHRSWFRSRSRYTRRCLVFNGRYPYWSGS